MTTGMQAGVASETAEAEELERLLGEIPHLTDKMVLDLINGLEVTKEHQRVQARRQGFFDRACDAITGKGAHRQQLIDKNLATGLEAATVWLQNLQVSQIRTDRGIELVSTKLIETRSALRTLAGGQRKLHDQIGALEAQIERFASEVDAHLVEIHREVREAKLRTDALVEMGRIFDEWDAGVRFQGLPGLAQAALALEALYWTPFRRYDQVNPEFRDQVVHKCTSQLRRLTHWDSDVLMGVDDWYQPVSESSVVVREMVAYAFDGSEPEATPLRATLAAAAEEPGVSPWGLERAPLRLPRALSGRSAARKLVAETATGGAVHGV